MSGELLLELLSEEIPARMQRRAIADLVQQIGEWLQAHRISAAEMHGYVTPRRMTVIAEGVPDQLPLQREERRGPRVGAPQAALDGFLRSVGLTQANECEVRETDRGQFYFATIERPGRATTEVLPDLIYSTVTNFPWPKSMRFPAASLRWVRPLISILCLYDGEVLPLTLDQVPVGRTTRGHRFLSDGELTIENAADYRKKLEAASVVLDQDKRRDIIQSGLDQLVAAEGLTLKPDPGLLDEVTGLVEYPVVLMGRIEEESMALPPEVLETAMRTHQKYFSCLTKDNVPAPRFLFVANNRTADDGKTIIAGNERVLRARLADARFFWEQDCKIRLEDRVPGLASRVYHAKLGSVLDKIERMQKLAMYLAAHVERRTGPRADSPGIALMAERAMRLAKADLSSGIVGEFPELQGIMGRYYALQNGEHPQIAQAIADHYKPQGPSDTCPYLPVTVAVALADKLDTLSAFFTIGEVPTGSRDPFALRRAALGVIRLILENRLRLSLGHAFAYTAVQLNPDILTGGLEPTSARDLLLEFIADRLKVHLREKGVRHDLIAAVFALNEDDLVRLLARVDALQKFLGSEDGANLLVAYRRASNIVGIEERRDSRTYDGEADPNLLRQDEEIELMHALGTVNRDVGDTLTREAFDEAMSSLATLRTAVDEFFAKVTVNADEPALRENRLRLLSRIRAVMNRVADFSQIEG